MSLFVIEMAISFFVGAVRCFVGLSASVALLLVFGMRLLMVLLWTLRLVLVDLVDRPGLGTVNSFPGNPCRVFSLNGNLNSTGEINSVSLTLKRAFKTASLLTEHMNLWRRASSCGSLIEGKSQVAAS